MQLIFDFPVNPKFRFDNFVVCDGNRTAFNFTGILADDKGLERLLYIYGPPGSGKTHLLSALAAGLGRSGPDSAAVPLFSFRDIDRLYRGDYRAETVSRLADYFREADALLIDDIHLIPDNINLKVELWQVFNDFHEGGKRIMITGLFPPKELPNLDGHLTSRLLWGLVARIDVSDDQSRRMIMKKVAEDLQTVLPEDVAEYLLVHVPRDVPSLMAAVEGVNRRALALKRKLTVKLARETLSGEV
jgi:chromosomal replication initiator protein